MSMSMHPPNTDSRRGVAIVGAGLAGLVAARTLHDRGHPVQVFDKGRGVGGRTSVRRHAPFDFDHGAQYFTVRDERFARVVQSWQDAGVVAPWLGRIVSFEEGGWRASASQVRYVGVPGMNAMARHLAAGLQVKTETRVNRLILNNGIWSLCGDKGETLGSFDAVVIAVPSDQAIELLTGLDRFAQCDRRCIMSPCWAAMLGFDQAIETRFDAAFIRGSPLSWIARNSSKPGRSVAEAWVLHASSEWSVAHLDDSPEEVSDLLALEFQRLLGGQATQPAFKAAHRWRYALPADPLDVGALWDDESKLAVCGDWCQGARIEGAFLSGLAAAERILQAPRPITVAAPPGDCQD